MERARIAQTEYQAREQEEANMGVRGQINMLQ